MKYNAGMIGFDLDIIKAVQSLIGKSEIEKVKKLAADGNASLLREYLKENHGRCYHSTTVKGYNSNTPCAQHVKCTLQQMIINYNYIIDNGDDSSLELTWSKVCVFIRNHINDIFPDTPTKLDIPAMRWDGNPAFEKDIHKALKHICILPVRDMIKRGDSSKDIAAYLRSEYKGVAGYYNNEWGFFLWYDENHLYIRYEGKMLNNQKADSISLTWSKVAKELIKLYGASDEEAPVPKEEKTMTGPAFNFGNFISESNTLKQLPLDMLVPRHNHRFKLYDGERLQDMIQSIKANGVLTPVIVLLISDKLVKNIEDELNSCTDEDKLFRLSEAAKFYRENLDKYEILAGHNRCNAAQLAGKTTVPGIVKENLSYDEAEMYVAETNFMQRGFDDLTITERASVLAARHSAMFDEDKRNAIVRELAILNGEEVEEDTDSEEKKSKLAAVGENYGLSKDTVARLIRIDKLVPELKPYVDEGRIAIRAAVNLSYLFTSEQKKVAEMIEFGVDMKKSTLLREVSRQNKLNDNAIREILVLGTYGAAPTTKKKPIKVKISTDISEKYFAPDWDETKVQDIINLALEQYFSFSNPDLSPESELDGYGLSEKCLSILKENGMENKEMIDEWLSFGDGEKVLGEKYHYEVMKKIFDSEDDEEFAIGELDDDFNEFDED